MRLPRERFTVRPLIVAVILIAALLGRLRPAADGNARAIS